MNNKILVTDNNIDFQLNKNIVSKILSDDEDIITVISIDILNDTELTIEYNITEGIKINFSINIHDNCKLKLIDKKIGKGIKSKYHVTLNDNSYILINKINDGTGIKEFDLVDLNGIKSEVFYVLKTISKTTEHYDIVVNHNKKETISNIITNAVNIQNGLVNFNVTCLVPKGCISSIVNQQNHIINFTNNKCQINPNLLIDEMDTSASHSAHISSFNKDDLFYLESRGINEQDALNLLIKGFLMDNILDIENKYITSLVKKYWG